MEFSIAPSIVKKLAEKHNIQPDEVVECFSNVTGGYLIDTMEDHQTTPPTHWFIAETNGGRELCVCFLQMPDKSIQIKTAFEPNDGRKHLYKKLTGEK